MGDSKPELLSDRIEVERNGERITVWNHLTVAQEHYVLPGQIMEEHYIATGDAPERESPDYITPAMDDQLRYLDVYPNAEVVDPFDDEVTIL